jgi:hypothetical protein
MLFPYTYVPHQMDRVQEFIDYIFFEIWCKAPVGLVFHPDLFDGNLDLKEVMSEFGFSAKAPASGKAFYKEVKEIYELFAKLPAQEIEQFKCWYQGNNDLEKVCANDPTAQVVRYADIEANYPKLTEQLASFFKELYSRLSLADLHAKIGDIDDHYKAFSKINRIGKCPFCGIDDLLGANHTPRDAYDHYLPKALYPFNSANFKNLVPACHHCNSSYKTSKDPIYTPKDAAGATLRRKAFFPFSTTHPVIDIKVTLPHLDLQKMTPAEVAISFGPSEVADQIETWKNVYGIVERYRAKLLGGDAMAWLVEVLDEWRWNEESAGVDGKPPEKYLREVSRHAVNSPYANGNFLKHSFLQSCKAVGLFDAGKQVGAAA